MDNKMNSIRVILNRLYSDFIMPSRLAEYESIQKLALANGYEMLSIRSFWEIVSSGKINKDKKYFINRHDIDTDLITARKIFDIDKSCKVNSSFYFRLENYDVKLMRDIENNGCEASYHYEELSSYAKSEHIKKGSLLLERIAEIRAAFERNITRLRKETGLPMLTVAAHGDFVNRKLGIINTAVLDDKALRTSLNIILEAYDKEFQGYFTSKHSDCPYPVFYNPCSPRDSILRGEKVIHFLTHPRHWETNIYENMKDNIKRSYEGIIY